jgi:glycosyltransferase involved in cell wall biosynthesis
VLAQLPPLGRSVISAGLASKADTNALPRVLFVTSFAFNGSTGGGVTFSNLFRGWPKDRLATAHNDTTLTSDQVCDCYYLLGPDEVRRRWPFHSLAGALATAPEQGAPIPTKLGATWLARRIKQRVFGDGLPETATLSPALARFVDEFRPQVLYSILGGAGILKLVELIRTRWKLPLVVHVMDDWRDTIYGNGWLSSWQRDRVKRDVARLIRVAKVRIGISDAMSDAFAADYGVPFMTFQNAVDVTQWRVGKTRDAALSPTPRLLYSGALLPFAQGEAVVEVAEAVASLASSGMPVRFDIHCPPDHATAYRTRLELGPAVRLLPPFAQWSDYSTNLGLADALVLPVNFDKATIRFIRYSMPTKVPEYLISGTPVLVYGPCGVAQVDDAQRYGWGHTVTTHSRGALAEGIRRVLHDAALRQELCRRSTGLAVRRHDLSLIQARFRRALVSAAAGTNVED